MNPQTLKLYELLGSKELSFGCILSSLQVYPGDEYYLYYRIGGEKTDYNGALGDKREYFACSSFPNGTSINSFLPKFHFLNTDGKNYIIIGHTPTIADLHRWLNEKFTDDWEQAPDEIYLGRHYSMYNSSECTWDTTLPYNSSLPLLDQPTETLDAIIELINNHK